MLARAAIKLSKHSQSDLNRIAPAGIDSNANIVGDTTVLDGDRLADPPTDTINDNGSKTADMGSYRTLADFVQWGSSNYPADHLAVVVWDHGSGALNVNNRAAKSGKLKRGTPTTARCEETDARTIAGRADRQPDRHAGIAARTGKRGAEN